MADLAALDIVADHHVEGLRQMTKSYSLLFDELIDGIKAVDATAVMILIGIDLRRLSRFRALTPRVTRYAMGHRETAAAAKARTTARPRSIGLFEVEGDVTLSRR